MRVWHQNSTPQETYPARGAFHASLKKSRARGDSQTAEADFINAETMGVARNVESAIIASGRKRPPQHLIHNICSIIWEQFIQEKVADQMSHKEFRVAIVPLAE